jgi:hypothetical protein
MHEAPPRVLFAHRLAEAGDGLDPLQALRDAIVFSSADWGAARDFAWIYGIVVGWDSDEDDDPDEVEDTMLELAAVHGWTAEKVERLRALHGAFVELAARDVPGVAPLHGVPPTRDADVPVPSAGPAELLELLDRWRNLGKSAVLDFYSAVDLVADAVTRAEAAERALADERAKAARYLAALDEAKAIGIPQPAWLILSAAVAGPEPEATEDGA